MKRASKLRRENWISQLMTSIALNVDSTLIIWFYTIKILFYILSWCCLFSPPLHLATKVISYNLMHWFMCICQHTQAKHTDWNYLFYRLFRLLLRYHLSISRLLCHCCSHCSSYNNSTRKNEVVVRPANNPLLVIFQHYFLSSSFGGLHSLSPPHWNMTLLHDPDSMFYAEMLLCPLRFDYAHMNESFLVFSLTRTKTINKL